MRAVVAGVLSLMAVGVGVGVGACGTLSGLSDYETVPFGLDEASEPATDSASDEGGDAGDDSSAAWNDANGNPPTDGSPMADAVGVPDVAADAAPPCSPSTCGGCCKSGTCVGGQSVATCGVGGSSCRDCTSQGACSGGACVAPVKDAGPTMTCKANQCFIACIPVYQGACCKSDQTCGCQVVIPSAGSCN